MIFVFKRKWKMLPFIWLVMDVRSMIVAKKDGSTKNLDMFHHFSGGWHNWHNGHNDHSGMLHPSIRRQQSRLWLPRLRRRGWGGCEGRSASATKPGEGHSPLGWGHERTRIRPGFGWRVFLIFVSSWHWNILKSCFLGIRLRLGSYLVDPEATVPSFYPEVCLN